MKVAVIGPGAMGCTISYYLYSAGIEPTIVCRRRIYVESILKRGGLVVVRKGHPKKIRVRPVTLESAGRGFDLVFIAVKAYDSVDAARAATSILNEGGVIVFIQNGIGGLDSTLELLKRYKVAAMVLSYGAVLEDPGIVRITGEGRAIMGYIEREPDDALKSIKRILSKGGFNVDITGRVQEYRWLKLIVNCAVNGLTSLLQVKNGALIEIEEFKVMMERVVDEAKTVAYKAGIDLPADPLEETIKVIEETRDNYSSTLQDLMRGRRTEIDFINGYIVYQGRRLGVPTPYNELIYNGVKGLESWRRRLRQ